MHKWFEAQMPKWVEKAEKMTENIAPEESIYGMSVHMMTHMRKIIAESTQTIAGLKKQIDDQAKKICQLQKATANTCPKMDKTEPKNKPATKGELDASERKVLALLCGKMPKGDVEGLKNWAVAVSPIESLGRKLKVTNEVMDSERDKRLEAQRNLLLTKERVRKLEANANGEGQEGALRQIKNRLSKIEESKSGDQEISEDALRMILRKLAPEIEVMIAQSVDRIMEGIRSPVSSPRHKEGSSFRRRMICSSWTLPPPKNDTQPSPKRAKTAPEGKK